MRNESAKGKRQYPFERLLLRSPGQYLTEEMVGMLLGIFMHSFFIVFGAYLIYSTVWSYYHPVTFSTVIVMSGFSILLIIYSLYFISKTLKKYRCYELGRDGEKRVSQILREQQGADWQIYDDIQFHGAEKDYNIDHLVIAPQGIFCIETKTNSAKPGKTKTVFYDGSVLRVGDFKHYPNNPKSDLSQAKRNGYTIQKSLQSALGRSYEIQPILVFPEASVIPRGRRFEYGDECWVMNPKQVSGAIKSIQAENLSKDDLSECKRAIKSHILNFQRRK